MADGVDHIDIYADVEEDFNQVCKPLHLLKSYTVIDIFVVCPMIFIR